MAQVNKKADNPERVERRRSQRHRLCLDAEARTSRGSTARIVLHELSQSGCLMETAAPVSVGEAVQLRLAQEEGIAARVVWSCGQHFGCEFQRAMSTAALSAALLKARPARAGEGLPRRLRLKAEDPRVQVATGVDVLRGQLPLILGLAVVLWAALAIAFLYAS